MVADSPSVSIVMGTFNGEAYLDAQLDSLARQTSLPDELIISDDCSDDGTAAIIKSFSRRAPFVVDLEVNATREGFRRNFMAAASRARSELILFCDQDDIWRPDKVAVIRQAFRHDPQLVLAYHNASVIDSSGQRIGSMFDGPTESAVWAGGEVPPWHYARGLVQAFRREFLAFHDLWPLSREHFSDDPLGHDRWSFFLALALGKIAFIDRDLLGYRQHGGNAYGVDRKPAVGERIGKVFRHNVQADARSEAGARSRVAVLQALAARVGDDRRERVLRLASAYEAFATRVARRQVIYADRTIGKRGSAFARSILHGDYRGAPWGFKRLSVLRDAIGGVLLATGQEAGGPPGE